MPATDLLAPWYGKVLDRAAHRPLPAVIREALETIEAVRAELLMSGRMEPLSRHYPAGTRHKREARHCTPPHWKLSTPAGFVLGLEIATETEEERTELEQRRAAWRREVEETRALYREARDAWDMLAPIERANEHLQHALGLVAMEGRDITDPRVADALMSYRRVLTTFYPHNPAVAAHLLELEQALDRIRDTLRCMLLKDLFAHKFTDEQAREAIALLEGEAAAGHWPDAEADVERAEAEA